MCIIIDLIKDIQFINYIITFTDEDIKHVMISYNWGCQEQMLILRDKLRAAGYKVWMDVDSLGKYFPALIFPNIENTVAVAPELKESLKCYN